MTVATSSGVASFSGLTLNKAASGYTLVASGGGYGWGVTSTITVTPASATQLVINQQPPATVKVNRQFGRSTFRDAQKRDASRIVSLTQASLSGGFRLRCRQFPVHRKRLRRAFCPGWWMPRRAGISVHWKVLAEVRCGRI
jgi:hypothetical protein